MKITRDGIEGDFYYIYWWNWLPKKYRYFGYEEMWHDGIHHSFGLWFTNITWRLPWSRMNPRDW